MHCALCPPRRRACIPNMRRWRHPMQHSVWRHPRSHAHRCGLRASWCGGPTECHGSMTDLWMPHHMQCVSGEVFCPPLGALSSPLSPPLPPSPPWPLSMLSCQGARLAALSLRLGATCCASASAVATDHGPTTDRRPAKPYRPPTSPRQQLCRSCNITAGAADCVLC